VAYYTYVQRHLADELLVIGSDLDYVLAEAFGTYLPALLGVCLLLMAGGWLWRRILAVELRPSRRPAIVFSLLILGCTLGTRGTLDRKSLGLIDAFASGSAPVASLSLNGVFTAYHATKGAEVAVDHEFLETGAVYQELGLEDVPYPLLRQGSTRGPSGLNLVILLLESWDPRYIDSYDGSRLGITPRFDALAGQSRRFDNCYAAGQRSLEAIQAVLTGVPPVVGEPPLGWGLRLANVTQIGTVAERHGYETLFIQSSRRRSYRLDSAAASLGFRHYYGQEDIPTRLAYPSTEKPKWGWDYETLVFALERMDAFERPFVTFLFTGATHPPYPDPGERFRLREHAASGEDGFVNVLHYSDWALGEFMEAARTRPWYERTVFVIASDHIFRKAPREEGLRADFRVPFLIHAPAIVGSGVDARICSHLDALPTFFDLLGFGDGYAALGASLLAEREGFALVKKGSLMGIITEQGSVTHDLHARVSAETASSSVVDLDQIERRLLASVQLSHALLRANRWSPPQ
jgi:arylsulfatase A-like enzyme